MRYTLSQMEPKEFIPGFYGKMIHYSDATLAYWDIKAGSELPVHHHVHKQVVNLLEGRFSMIIDGIAMEFSAGDVFVIESNVAHSGKAITDCRILDVFTPMRADYQ